jgi:uncharacterized protein Smg (DUF494 family)
MKANKNGKTLEELSPSDIELIEKNRIIAEYIVMNDLSVEEIKELHKETRKFYQKLLTDKDLQNEVKELILESLKLEWGLK